jgi:hypothetical protein
VFIYSSQVLKLTRSIFCFASSLDIIQARGQDHPNANESNMMDNQASNAIIVLMATIDK